MATAKRTAATAPKLPPLPARMPAGLASPALYTCAASHRQQGARAAMYAAVRAAYGNGTFTAQQACAAMLAAGFATGKNSTAATNNPWGFAYGYFATAATPLGVGRGWGGFLPATKPAAAPRKPAGKPAAKPAATAPQPAATAQPAGAPAAK